MKRKTICHVLETAAFCAVLLGVIFLVSGLVERKASMVKFGPFLEEPEDYDVLLIGDSHMVNAVFPMQLWEDYGIASYNISSYGNTMPVSYWVMMNALDYASPKLIVIDVKDVHQSYKLTGSSSDVHTAFDCYPLSLTKIRAIEDLMDDPYAVDDDGNAYTDLKWEYYFTLGKYHTRWSGLSPGDLCPAYNAQKGAEMIIGVAEPNDYDIIDERQALEESGCGFEYLRRMIEECQSRGIGVMLTHLPYPSSEKDQMSANAVRYIAEEYGIGYIDFVSLDQVVDYRTDCYDSFSHLNPSGARKVTDYLGRYITEHYDMEDRRDDGRYADWAQDEESYTRLKLAYLDAQTSLENVLMLLHDEQFSVCVAVDGDSPLYDSEKLMLLMQNIGREHVFEEDEFSKWSDALFPLEALDAAAAERADYVMVIDRLAGAVYERTDMTDGTMELSFGTLSFRGQGGDIALELMQDGQTAACFDGGEEADVRILVIDNRTGSVADQLQFAL